MKAWREATSERTWQWEGETGLAAVEVFVDERFEEILDLWQEEWESLDGRDEEEIEDNPFAFAPFLSTYLADEKWRYAPLEYELHVYGVPFDLVYLDGLEPDPNPIIEVPVRAPPVTVEPDQAEEPAFS